MQFYGYDKCSTCREAKKFLKEHGHHFEEIDITQNPPSRDLLSAILKTGRYKIPDLFNRSGELYRTLKMKDKIPASTDAELLELLSQHGKLIKRPVIADGKKYSVGFKDDVRQIWK